MVDADVAAADAVGTARPEIWTGNKRDFYVLEYKEQVVRRHRILLGKAAAIQKV